MSITVIKNIGLCDESKHLRSDIAIDTATGSIKEIAAHIVPGTQDRVIHYKDDDKVIMPSFYDLGVRLDNNTLNKQSLKTITQKAQQSGVQYIGILPDSTPAISSEWALELLADHNAHSYTKLLPISHTLVEGHLAPIATLLHRGALALYLDSCTDSNIIRRVCEYAMVDHTPLICACFNKTLSDGDMFNGLVASKMGIAGIDLIAQTSEVYKMIPIGQFFDIPIIFSNIICPKSVDAIYQIKNSQIKNKKEGNFFVQTPIHHLIHTDRACSDFNTTAKLFPPLLDEAHQEQLIAAFSRGEINLLTALQSHSDNSATPLPFEEASSSVNDLHLYFSIAYTYLVKAGYLSLTNLSEILTGNAIRAMGLKREIPRLEVGQCIDELLWIDLDKAIDTTQHAPSLYSGQELWGEVKPLSQMV